MPWQPWKGEWNRGRSDEKESENEDEKESEDENEKESEDENEPVDENPWRKAVA